MRPQHPCLYHHRAGNQHSMLKMEKDMGMHLTRAVLFFLTGSAEGSIVIPQLKERCLVQEFFFFFFANVFSFPLLPTLLVGVRSGSEVGRLSSSGFLILVCVEDRIYIKGTGHEFWGHF